MIGHSLHNLGRVFLEAFGVREDKISKERSFIWGVALLLGLLLLVTLLANLVR